MRKETLEEESQNGVSVEQTKLRGREKKRMLSKFSGRSSKKKPLESGEKSMERKAFYKKRLLLREPWARTKTRERTEKQRCRRMRNGQGERTPAGPIRRVTMKRDLEEVRRKCPECVERSAQFRGEEGPSERGAAQRVRED